MTVPGRLALLGATNPHRRNQTDQLEAWNELGVPGDLNPMCPRSESAARYIPALIVELVLGGAR
jgi:hypothetical protein